MKPLIATLVTALVVALAWRVWPTAGSDQPRERLGESASVALAEGAETATPPRIAELESGPESTSDRTAVESAARTSAELPGPLVVHGNVRRDGGAALTAPVEVVVALHANAALQGDVLQRSTTRTDAAGQFAVEFPRPTVDVYVDARVRAYDLYSWRHDPVHVPVDTFTESLQLIVGPLDATLTGLVTRPDGTPIAGATVRFAHLVAETDDAGRYALRVNSAYCDRATASASGHGARTRSVAKLTAGSEDVLDFALLPGLSIRGTVRDEDSAPVAGARLRLWSNGDHEAVSATSDSDGRYALLDVARMPDALVHLEVRAAGHVLQMAELTLPTEGDLQHDVRLARGARVSGQVIDERGQPVPGAKVWVGLARHYIDCMQTQSDEAGNFELLGVGPGRQQLGVVHQGSAEYVEKFEVPADARELPPFVARLERGRTVTGTVVDELGRPVAGVSVHARRKGAEGVLGVTAVDGTFTLERVPDVELLLSTSADDWQEVEMKVPAGSSGPLELRLTRACRLGGRVVDAVSGAPIRTFTVRLVEPEQQADERRVMGWGMKWEQGGVSFDAADGRWSTSGESLTPGEIGVEVSATGYEPLLVPRALVANDESAEELVHALHSVRR